MPHAQIQKNKAKNTKEDEDEEGNKQTQGQNLTTPHIRKTEQKKKDTQNKTKQANKQTRKHAIPSHIRNRKKQRKKENKQTNTNTPPVLRTYERESLIHMTNKFVDHRDVVEDRYAKGSPRTTTYTSEFV